MPEYYFFILHEHGIALTGLKHFRPTNSLFWLLLVIQKCYTHNQKCCIFHTQRCIFRRVLYGKYSTVIRLMFAYANALTPKYYMVGYWSLAAGTQGHV